MTAVDHPDPQDRPGGDFDRFLLLLGRLNYSWTNTESLLIHLIAGLSHTDKETAVVIFLTLNTTRARIDLVERLSKLERVSQTEREAVLEITRRIKLLSGLRNKYNHCIYSFNSQSGDISTIRMRVADRKNQIKVGQKSALDGATIDDIEQSLNDLKALNSDVWMLIQNHGYPA
ncbi:hypothetical protein GCM10016455_06900 [Aliiroseovarius zhejiangensis]|uniref:HEPN AbiU2-like domain-containing protein n=1 Tax=Aliiroseovarius zhejiangensis TaxID=1632025 RepID=A0ABQ3IP44_9RHOB|nr:hypothetical protein [Aliiroseovarius zhejiangensis]GHE89284.1 hypothetical protein GCM10016455_06900 [Aliiroseovarius zhejiangensis]